MKRWHYTVKKGEIAQLRKETYKSPEAYERAFYKFICKQGWYSNLKDGFRPPEPNGNGGYWMQGYPFFRSWNSDSYRSFNNAGRDGIENGYKKIREALRMEEIQRVMARDELRNKWKRVHEAENITGVSWLTATIYLGLIPDDRDPCFPLDAVEAKQFQMGITTLLNADRNKKRNSHESRKRTQRRTVPDVQEPQGGEGIHPGSN